MSSLERCDEITRLIDEVLRECAPAPSTAPDPSDHRRIRSSAG